MKVVHISTSDVRGGAGRAAYRIHKALKKKGVDSNMLVFRKFGDDEDVVLFKSKGLQTILKKLRSRCEKIQLNSYKDRKKTTFSVGTYGVNISKLDIIKNADILNLHWVTKNFLSLKSIEQIARMNKKIVWRLPDMWAFTGGCHYSGFCSRYTERCGECPVLNSNKLKDLSWEILSRKSKIFRDLDFQIISPSNWLADCVKRSFLFKDFPLKVIPNSIDTDIFKPVDKKKARKLLNLSEDKILVLFGLSPGVSIERKGINYLIEALLMLNHNFPDLSNNIELLVLGLSYSEKIHNIPFKTKFLGSIKSDYDINLCYNAADFFISPSLEEAFGLTFIEAMSCGTPCIAFNHGGPVDIIDHKKNGYLAKYKSAEDLTRGIRWFLEDKKRLQVLGENAREKVVKNYTHELIGGKYLQLYNDLLKI